MEEVALTLVVVLAFLAFANSEPVKRDIELMSGKSNIETVIEEFMKAYEWEDPVYSATVLNNRVILDGVYRQQGQVISMLDTQFGYYDFENVKWDFIEVQRESRFDIATIWVEYRQTRYDDLKPRDPERHIWKFMVKNGRITSWNRKPDKTTEPQKTKYIIEGGTVYPQPSN